MLHADADDIRYMRLALEGASQALRAGEVPIGCIIVAGKQIVGRGHNLTETLQDTTAHAEMQAITAAAHATTPRPSRVCMARTHRLCRTALPKGLGGCSSAVCESSRV